MRAAPNKVRLSVCIQHHPDRPDLPRRLIRSLRPGRAAFKNLHAPLIEVVTDPDPGAARNPWRTARLCWQRTPDSCTHRLLLQDDALPCRDALLHVVHALTARPDRVTSFFLGQYPSDAWRAQLVASQRCAAWVMGTWVSWVPCVALAIPRRLCASLAAFDDGTQPVADDDVVGRWARDNRIPWYATIPSLFDHDDSAPSLMRDRYSRGKRSASCWIGNEDPGLIDWSIE